MRCGWCSGLAVHTLLCISQGAELEQEQELRLLYGLSCCLEALTMYYSVESVSPLSKPSGPNDGRTDVMASTSAPLADAPSFSLLPQMT